MEGVFFKDFFNQIEMNYIFRSCIIEAFERAKKVYGQETGEDLKCDTTYQQLLKKYDKNMS